MDVGRQQIILRNAAASWSNNAADGSGRSAVRVGPLGVGEVDPLCSLVVEKTVIKVKYTRYQGVRLIL